MSLWSRIANAFRADRLNSEIDEELESHIQEAIEQGRDPEEARRAFGPMLRKREEVRDMRLMPWLDSLRADAIFGWRRLNKTKVTSMAAILSLALAIGACTAAFRLIDALLLRPLPIAHPERLYVLSRHGWGPDGKANSYDTFPAPSFYLMRAAVKDQAEVIGISGFTRNDLKYGSDQDMEKAYIQYVSGWMFDAFGLRPAAGRLFHKDDDVKPGANPIAVISYDYWARRFRRDPGAIGRTFHLGSNVYQIVGVGPETFTGTETGTVIDVFLPMTMHYAIAQKDNTWLRAFVQVPPGVQLEPLREKLNAVSHNFEAERAKGFTDMPKGKIDIFMREWLSMDPAASGTSYLQQEYSRSLMALGTLVALVLLIACANVANLMTAQAAARSREMALRVSIGAGRWRLVQLILVESAMIAIFALALGAVFASWAAPFVVGMINPPDNPARLALPADLRVLGFGALLTLGVTFLFGLAPALRASHVKPAAALKGGEDPRSRRRSMNALIATQVAFCFLVLFIAGLFITTFKRLSNRPLGFSADRLLLLDTVTPTPESPLYWSQVSERLREEPGVERVALAGWPLLTYWSHNNYLSFHGETPTGPLCFFLNVSPGWLDTMKIPLLEGRDFRPEDVDPGSAIVNETFVKTYLNGENPIGKTFLVTYPHPTRSTIIGLVPDSRYSDMRETQKPVAYVPFQKKTENGELSPVSNSTIFVRTAGNPLALASFLRAEIPRIRSEFRVSNLRTQQEVIDAQTVRERLLAILALFFAVLALLLAAIGLYGVLNYSVVQRRREIGIRIAIGAPAEGIAMLVTREIFVMVLLGAVAGLCAGLGCARYIEALFYQVKATDAAMLTVPAISILAAAMIASMPAIVQAVRIDPVNALRSE